MYVSTLKRIISALGDTLVAPIPYLIFPGGRKGLTSGDFNGDGYVDIAALVDSVPKEEKRFGRISKNRCKHLLSFQDPGPTLLWSTIVI